MSKFKGWLVSVFAGSAVWLVLAYAVTWWMWHGN